MVGISQWGMFDARDIPYSLWPLRWASSIDCVFEMPFADNSAAYVALLRYAVGK